MAHPKDKIHYRHIPIRGNTKAWFKHDFQVIKNSFISTLKNFHLITLFTCLIVLALWYFGDMFTFTGFLWYLVSFDLIFTFGYFLLKVLKDKGYDVGRGS